MPHPYKQYPPRQFWSKVIDGQLSIDDLVAADRNKPLLLLEDKIASAGSCFASNMIPYIERNGFTYLRTEYTHPVFSDIPAENMGYAKFSAGYGNIYSARQFKQLILRAIGEFIPQEDRWYSDSRIIDPFRPGLRYPAISDYEFDALTTRHLAATREAFSKCTVMIYTLGLTEAWRSKIDGAVYPACPGTIAGKFDPTRHEFINFSVDEICGDLEEGISLLRKFNPALRIILTVSPVPLVATATDKHVLLATTLSKSVLRVAAEQVTKNVSDVFYFPAYEIITGPQAPSNYFATDRRNVSEEGINAVMSIFLRSCGTHQDKKHKLLEKPSNTETHQSNRIIDIECEEAAQDIRFKYYN
ncbi:GSCFA domain-containing protein [Rhizobium lusitanum]|uniref:GSCFA domain-containing protein n=1 Tax=Rhizobium lusitanum TaxID=293958 RepID=A0A6L9U9A8_9HYPH|nr:GSCFA domain-containing protein [Rhizobium lusitanum]NEI71971.1 GSCFA domain-containing protein [Rhizobium lusitanum]